MTIRIAQLSSAPDALAVPAWQRTLAAAVRDPAVLLARLDLDRALLPAARRAAARFGLLVPEPFLRRIRPGDPADPLLRQVLPLGEELDEVPGFGGDPVGDAAARRPGGVLHKYHGRALLVATGACAVHCRYCFRRAFPYQEANASADGWRDALDYLRANEEISEVILSGGDPLTLSDRRLSVLVERLDGIAHLGTLRIHTRLPVVVPERVDQRLLDWLSGTRLKTVVVIHANHPNELDDEVGHALARLKRAGATLLNQAVLLRGVNDRVDTLAALSERLFELDVLPYYLHVLDRVTGAAHFEVPEHEGRMLHDALTARLPGYLVPRLVREEPGAPAKTRL
ncbi:MAG TPA: EF-P beta-lysylation protein EpmB [Pseudomonadales bacterium]